MWQRHKLPPSTAVGMLMAVGLLFLILLGVTLLVQLLWALAALGLFFLMKRRMG